MRKILCFLALALFTVTANAEVWTVGERADITQLKAGDVIALKSITSNLSTNPSAVWFSCNHTIKNNNFGSGIANAGFGMFAQLNDKSAFKLVEGPGYDGKKSFYLQEMTSGQYIALTRETKGSISLVANPSDATDFCFEKNPNKDDAEWLVHYEGTEGWHFTPFHGYGFMYYGTAGDMQGWNFYYASESDDSFMLGEQVGLDELEDGMELMLRVSYSGYYTWFASSLGERYLQNRMVNSDERAYNPFSAHEALATSSGYNESNVWVLEYASPATTDGYSDFYYLKSKATGEYIFLDTDHSNQSANMTSDKSKAMAFTFATPVANATIYGYESRGSIRNDKTVAMLCTDASKPKFGSAHGYGYALFNSETFATWNLHKIVAVSDDTKKTAVLEQLQALITDDEAKYTGDWVTDRLPGYDAASVTAYNAALATAKTMTTANTLDEITTAYNTLASLPIELEIENGKYYYIVSALTSRTDKPSVSFNDAASTLDNTTLQWGVLNNTDGKYIFQFTANDSKAGYWYIQNLANDRWIGNGDGSYGVTGVVSTLKDKSHKFTKMTKDGLGSAYFWTTDPYDYTSWLPSGATNASSTSGNVTNWGAAGDNNTVNENRWYLYPVTDESIIANIKATKDANIYTTVQELIANAKAKNIKAGNQVGDYSVASATALNDAIADAEALTAIDDLQDLYDAAYAIKYAYVNLNFNYYNVENVSTITNGYYYLVSAYTGRTDAPAATIDKSYNSTYMSWGLLDKTDTKYIFKFTANGSNWDVQNVANGLYAGTTTEWYGRNPMIAEDNSEPQIFTLRSISGLPDAWFWGRKSYPQCSPQAAGYGNSSTKQGLLYTWGQIGETPSDLNNRWYVIPAGFDLTIGATGYSTYVSDTTLIIPEGVTAYGVTGTEDGELVLAALSGNVLAANEPVILQGEAGKTYLFLYADSHVEGNEISGNLLEGTGNEGKAVGDNEAYVLYNREGTAVLRPAAAMTIPAHKAYLPAGVVDGSGSRIFTLSDSLTGISNEKLGISNSAESQSVYDLFGRKVEAPQKGQLYIVNGKAVKY